MIDLALARERIERANETVKGLCQGDIRWHMSIPARPDSDPDLLIFDGLHIAELLLAEAEQLRRICQDVYNLAYEVVEDDCSFCGAEQYQEGEYHHSPGCITLRLEKLGFTENEAAQFGGTAVYQCDGDGPHLWLEDITMNDAGDLMISSHTCKGCNKPGYEMDDEGEDIAAADFNCDGCGRLYVAAVHHMTCPHCGYDNVPF